MSLTGQTYIVSAKANNTRQPFAQVANCDTYLPACYTSFSLPLPISDLIDIDAEYSSSKVKNTTLDIHLHAIMYILGKHTVSYRQF